MLLDEGGYINCCIVLHCWRLWADIKDHGARNFVSCLVSPFFLGGWGLGRKKKRARGAPFPSSIVPRALAILRLLLFIGKPQGEP